MSEAGTPVTNSDVPARGRDESEPSASATRVPPLLLRDVRAHYDAEHLCPICGAGCYGYIAYSQRSALCMRVESPTPDARAGGWWHHVKLPCRCGHEHASVTA